jgi:uncharacterized protein YjbI with pentapeptide repeats
VTQNRFEIPNGDNIRCMSKKIVEILRNKKAVFFSVAMLVASLIGVFVVKPQFDNASKLGTDITALEKEITEEISLKDRIALKKDILSLRKDLASNNNQFLAAGLVVTLLTTYLTWFNAKLTEKKQIAERINKAVDQLNEDSKPTAQSSAIYTLEKIAKDSPQEQQEVLEILTTFIRVSSTLNNQGQLKLIEPPIQIAIMVIGRIKSIYDKTFQIDLSRTNLAGCKFFEVKSSNKVSWKNTIFRGSDLRNSILEEVNFNDVDFSNANMSGINKKLLEDKLPVKKSDFVGAILESVNLEYSQLSRSDFSEAILDNATLSHANLFEAVLTGASLVNADLSEANLSKAKLSNARLHQATMKGANISGCDFSLAKGLDIDQVRSAINWKKAKFDQKLALALGLN